jgi:hypothetical protein
MWGKWETLSRFRADHLGSALLYSLLFGAFALVRTHSFFKDLRSCLRPLQQLVWIKLLRSGDVRNPMHPCFVSLLRNRTGALSPRNRNGALRQFVSKAFSATPGLAFLAGTAAGGITR